jgi:hypothetical protein
LRPVPEREKADLFHAGMGCSTREPCFTTRREGLVHYWLYGGFA